MTGMLVPVIARVVRKLNPERMIAVGILLYVVGWLVAGGLFWLFEHGRTDVEISLWDSLYWANVTIPTLGYGDLFPTTVGGRILALNVANFSGLLGVTFFTVGLLGAVVKYAIHGDQDDESIDDDLCALKKNLLDGADVVDYVIHRYRADEEADHALLYAAARVLGEAKPIYSLAGDDAFSDKYDSLSISANSILELQKAIHNAKEKDA
jgi:hypothetical protein